MQRRKDARGRIAAALPSCSRAWPEWVGESEQAATECSCAGQSGPLRRCDRVEHALSSTRSHGILALNDQSSMSLWRLSWVW